MCCVIIIDLNHGKERKLVELIIIFVANFFVELVEGKLSLERYITCCSGCRELEPQFWLIETLLNHDMKQVTVQKIKMRITISSWYR